MNYPDGTGNYHTVTASSAIRFASGVPVITVKTILLAALKPNGTFSLAYLQLPLNKTPFRPAQNPTKRHVTRQNYPHSFINPTLQTKKTRSALEDVVTREYTIHMHKLVHGRSFKKRAPWAVKSVVAFAQKVCSTCSFTSWTCRS
jgi:hypothetical protein